MLRRSAHILAITALLLSVLASASSASAYFGWKFGGYSPRGQDVKDAEPSFDHGPVFGLVLNRHVGVEMDLGFFNTDVPYPVLVSTDRAFLSVISIAASAVLEQRFGRLGIYGMAGGALHSADASALFSEDHAVTPGYTYGAGLHYLMFGAEVQYRSYRPELFNRSFDADGIVGSVYMELGR